MFNKTNQSNDVNSKLITRLKIILTFLLDKPSRQRVLFALLIIIADSIILRNVLFINGFQIGDISVLSNRNSSFYDSLFSGWNFQFFGGQNGWNLYVLVEWFLTAETKNAGFAEKILFYPVLPLSSIFCFILLENWGLKRLKLWFLSLLYQLSPWFISQFMSGEPALEWVYVLLPLYITLLLRTTANPKKSWPFIWIFVIDVVVSAFSLQNLFILIFVTIPFLGRLFSLRTFDQGIRIAIKWASAGVISTVSNLLTLPILINAATELSPTLYFSSFLSPYALALKFWIALIVGVSACCLLLLPIRTPKCDKAFVEISILIGTFFGLIYFLIPNKIIYWMYDEIFILKPFIDHDKFLLMEWLIAFFAFTIYIRDEDFFFTLRRTNGNGRASAKTTYQHSMRKRSLNHVDISKRFVLVFLILLILFSSSVFASVHPISSHSSGYYFFQGKFDFANHQVPTQYYTLANFLYSHGSTFGLSYHVLVLPQNPGNVVPWYLGGSLIPGYVFPSKLMLELGKAFISNNSQYLKVFALLGIKYIVIMPPCQRPAYSSAYGPPVVQYVGPNEYALEGNMTTYYDILNNWTNAVRKVYEMGSITVFQNLYYSSPILSISNLTTVNEFIKGNFTGSYNLTPVSHNLVINGNLTNGTYWNIGANNGPFPSSVNSILPNGTFKLSFGSYGIGADQFITLSPNSTYIFSFHLKTNQNYSGYPPINYSPTYSGIYWNSYTDSNISGGGAISATLGSQNRTFINIFHTPRVDWNISAEVVLAAEPPLYKNATFYTSYSSVRIIRVNGSDIFGNIVKGIQFSVSSITTYKMGHENSSIKGESVVMDTMFDNNWRAILSNGKFITATEGVLGLLSFNLTSRFFIVKIFYAGQANYNFRLYIALMFNGAVIAVSLTAVGRWMASMLEGNLMNKKLKIYQKKVR